MTVQEYARKHRQPMSRVYRKVENGRLAAVKNGHVWDISDTELASDAATHTTNGTGLKQKLAALEARLAELEQVVLGGE